ncbi:MAG: hypothetical protein QM813_18540 [Verrucomicrobiota bacterium]
MSKRPDGETIRVVLVSPMKISATRTGGFAGLTEDLGSVETAQLDAAARKAVELLVQRVDFFHLPERLPGEVGADLFTYAVTVADGSRQHTVTFVGEAGRAMTLRELIAVLPGMK